MVELSRHIRNIIQRDTSEVYEASVSFKNRIRTANVLYRPIQMAIRLQTLKQSMDQTWDDLIWS